MSDPSKEPVSSAREVWPDKLDKYWTGTTGGTAAMLVPASPPETCIR